MSYKFIDIPRFVSPKIYENTVDKIVDFLAEEESVRAIYRLGNVNHPGISDLDILVIFKEGSQCSLNPYHFLNMDDKYLVTHQLFGVSEGEFRKVMHYSFWDNLDCIWGTPVDIYRGQNTLSELEYEYYKRQIGLEFLYKNYIELCVQRKYKVIKLRSIIQEIKGVRYDLAFLNIEALEINKLMSDFLNHLAHWFEKSFDSKEFSLWLDQYHKALKETIIHANKEKNILWVPKEGNFRYGRNIVLKNGPQLKCNTSGVFLSPWLISQNKKIYNAHQRLNRFEVTLEFNSEDKSGLNIKRFNAFKNHKLENRQYYPHFGALMTSLASQLI